MSKNADNTPPSEWVALLTFSDEDGGGVYPDEPQRKAAIGARELAGREHIVVCPRCGYRFAATEDSTAESNRDLHFDGDEDIPSICRNMPSRRRLTLVKGDG